MPKHAFRFPRPVIQAVKAYVERVVDSIDPKSFQQEPTYTTALIARLLGIAYEGDCGFVEFKGTVINSIGKDCAEFIWGGDFVITATISDHTTRIEKAILFQAKLGEVANLSAQKLDGLREQIRKMRNAVAAPKVMEIPQNGMTRDPRVISGNRILYGGTYKAQRLSDYIVSRVTTTLDGTTNPFKVAALKESSLSQLDVLAKIKQS